MISFHSEGSLQTEQPRAKMLKDCNDEKSQKQTCPNVLTRLSIPKSPKHIKFKSSFSLNIFIVILCTKGLGYKFVQH